MIRVEVKNADGVLEFSGDFETQEEADAWISQESANGDWGTDVATTRDVSAEYAKMAALQRGMRAQAIGAEVIAMVYAINDAKQLSIPQLQALMADPTLALAERLLKNGALATAKAVIQSLPDTAFSADEIAEVVAYIDSSGLA